MRSLVARAVGRPLLLILALAASGCTKEYWFGDLGSATPAASAAKSAAPASQVTLRVAGSTTIGATLAPKLVSAFLAKRGAKDVHVEKGEVVTTVRGTIAGKAVVVQIGHAGSGEGLKALADGSAEVAMSSRPIAPNEEALLAKWGDMTSPETEHVLGMDGIAIVVHPSNKIGKLTLAQLEGIFQGKITDWKMIAGGANGAIKVHARDAQSGTQESLARLAMHGRNSIAESATHHASGEELAAAVAKDPQAIGFVTFATGRTAAKLVAVQDADGRPATPTRLAIATEEYPLARRLFLYTPPRAQSAWAADLAEFAMSEEGQKLVDEAGFVSLNLESHVGVGVNASADGAPEGYAKAVLGAQRLSTNFRFKGASLDSRSARDLDRLARFIKATSADHRELALFGFTGDQGTDDKNVRVARDRARAVATQLEARGVKTTLVDGYGSGNAAAQSRGSRVEVWLR